MMQDHGICISKTAVVLGSLILTLAAGILPCRQKNPAVRRTIHSRIARCMDDVTERIASLTSKFNASPGEVWLYENQAGRFAELLAQCNTLGGMEDRGAT